MTVGLVLGSVLPVAGCRVDMDDRPPELIGATWGWERTVLNDDRIVVPEAPSHYTVIFQEDGSVAARVDCNRMGGTYRRDGASITIDLTHGTRAACPPGSLDDEFQRQLGEARQMVLSAEALHLDLAGHRGTMTFGVLERAAPGASADDLP